MSYRLLVPVSVLALGLVCAPHIVFAEQMATALTMHGTPKEQIGFDHYPYADPTAPKGGTIRQSAVGTFDTVNPFTIKGKAPQGMGIPPGPSLVHDRLMDRSWDEPFTLYPLIARGIQVTPDRSAITFYLDPRATFQDGSKITSADVAFSFTTLKDKGRPNMRRVYKLVSDMSVVDEHTIRFTLGPGHDRETVMILAMMPVLSKAYWATRDFEAATLTPGIASGPYKIASVEPGRRIVYERVPNYWAANVPTRKGLYNFDRFVFDYFRDDGVAFESFKSGHTDFRRETDLMKWIKGYDFPAKKRGDVVQAEVPHGRAETIRGFIMNTRRAPFDDIRVRHALDLTFDFDWVNKSLFAGRLQRTTSFFPNTDLSAPLAQSDAPSLRARMQEADTLLKDAGWIVKNGIRTHVKTGKPLTFELLLGSAGDEKTALAFIRSLKKLGISVTPRTLDTAAFRDRIQDYDYDMVLYFWQSTLSPGGEQLLYWGCDAAKSPGRFNYAGICDQRIDQLTTDIAHTTTRDELRSQTQELDQRLRDGYYVITLGYNPVDFVALSKKVKRPSTVPLYGVVPESWWMEPSAK